MNFLEKLLPIKREEVERLKTHPPHLKPRPNRPSFQNALAQPSPVPHLIGEIKVHSPSKGTLADPSKINRMLDLYNRYASAISILTDEHFFHGSFERLNALAAQSDLPLLCKDFIIDPFQIQLAEQAGASAILLIARLLPLNTLQELFETATQQGLDVLFEIHDEADLEKAITLHSPIIGINHRNLNTLEIDMSTSHRLRPLIPKSALVVAESGLSTRADLFALPPVNAILIGSSLMSANDPESLIQTLCQK